MLCYLLSAVESLRLKKFNVQKLIEIQEEKKSKIEEEIESAQRRANQVVENLALLKSAQKDLEATIAKAEEVFSKVG
jgi:predicted ribosome quality control (RQC) complex YloA/Tae2 family protein